MALPADDKYSRDPRDIIKQSTIHPHKRQTSKEYLKQKPPFDFRGGRESLIYYFVVYLAVKMNAG